MGAGAELDEGIESLRRSLLAASAEVGFEVHVRPLDPPRVPDALDEWDKAGEHQNCPQQLEVILRIDSAPDGRRSVDGYFVTWKWTDQVDVQADLRAKGWEGHPIADWHTWEVDLDDGPSLTLLLDDLRTALFAVGAQAETRISFDIVRGAAVSSALAPDEEWVDGASAADLQARLLALADARGGAVALALTTRPGVVVRLEARRRRVWLVVIGRLDVDREGAAKALRAAGWRPDGSQRHLRRSWRLPKGGPAMIPSERLFADLAHAMAALAGEPIGGAISMRLETRQAEVAWRGEGEEAPDGCLGWLLGSAGIVLAIIALALSGFDFPSGLADVLRELVAGSPNGTADKGYGAGRLFVLFFAWLASMVAAFVAAGLVIWFADRIRAKYDLASNIAEVFAAAVTIAFFVGLGLAGDSWGVVPASVFIGSFAILVIDWVLRRLRQSG